MQVAGELQPLLPELAPGLTYTWQSFLRALLRRMALRAADGLTSAGLGSSSDYELSMAALNFLGGNSAGTAAGSGAAAGAVGSSGGVAGGFGGLLGGLLGGGRERGNVNVGRTLAGAVLALPLLPLTPLFMMSEAARAAGRGGAGGAGSSSNIRDNGSTSFM